MTRFLPSMPGYVYAQNENDLYVNLFVGSESSIQLPAGKLNIIQHTEYPWNGKDEIEINPEKNFAFSLHVRVPGWAVDRPVPGDLYSSAGSNAAPLNILLNGKPATYKMDKGYAVIERNWKKGDKISFELPMDIKKISANEQVKADKDRFALQRGPIMYCLEGPDNKDAAVMNIVVDKNTPIQAVYKPELLNGVMTLEMKGSSTKRQLNSADLLKSTQNVIAIPYYSWANRGPGEMEVWIPFEESAAKPMPAPTIASKSKASGSIKNARMLKGLNDQYEPQDSRDASAIYLHWWPKKNSLEYVQYDFDSTYTVSETSVYWFDDGPFGGCRIPASWKLLYKKGDEWIPVKVISTDPIAKDKYNTIRFEPITTNAVKIEIQQPVDHSAGLHEWIIK